MSYFIYSMQLLGSEFKSPEYNIHPLNRSIKKKMKEIYNFFNYILYMFMSKLKRLVPQDYETQIEMFSLCNKGVTSDFSPGSGTNIDFLLVYVF